MCIGRMRSELQEQNSADLSTFMLTINHGEFSPFWDVWLFINRTEVAALRKEDGRTPWF